MTEPEEPTRWKRGAADAPDGFSELARADARSAPSDAALSRVIDKLALQVSAPEIARAFHVTTGTAPSPTAAAPSTGRHFGMFAKLVAAACVIGAIAIGLIALQTPQRAQQPQPVPHTVTTQPAQPQPSAPSPAPPGPSTTPPAATIPKQAASPATPARRLPATPSPSDPVAELHLLELAQQALRSDPARALAIAEQHKQRFARGQFAQEREMLAIQALVALGQNDRAAARARAFARRYPDSSHLPHLRDLVHMTP